METLSGQSGPHVTIQPNNGTPPLEKCGVCCSFIHCPFCSPSIFKPTVLSKVRKHLEGHKRRAVQHRGHTIFKCNLHCKEHAHFHCPSCRKLFDRRSRFLEHLLLCVRKEEEETVEQALTANCSDRTRTEEEQNNQNATENSVHMKTGAERTVNAAHVRRETEPGLSSNGSEAETATERPPIEQKRKKMATWGRESQIEALLHQALMRPRTPAPPPPSDEELFLRSLAPSLQRLSPKRKEYVKFQIHKLIYEASTEELNLQPRE